MTDEKNTVQAILRADKRPDEVTEKRFHDFFVRKYGKDFPLIFEKDTGIHCGFVLQVGNDLYDRTKAGNFRQLESVLASSAYTAGENYVSLVKDALSSFALSEKPEEVGCVLTVGDGIATVSGLPTAFYGEILVFEGGTKGMALSLEEDSIGCILFADDGSVSAGSPVYRTKKVAGMPCSFDFLGRVVDALGSPLDGKGKIVSDAYYPIEKEAPGIIDRAPVDTPMETGILSIDSMFPIGRGQRELIIGDRQTGKTTIALDTILNQKGKDVICIYVAIGQKASSVASLAATLEKKGALEYTCIVAATSADASPLLYISPYAATALGEYFMEKGKDVLIVYDDLSKHATAYRAVSLLLGRSPGREAYPGDVFYLHSRLLERSAHLSKKKGGGSLTALPIVETLAGDVSAYIPTNVISITDGQLFLDSDRFKAGERPAVSVGLSVSRVGRDAQTKTMKQAVGTLRLDLAQYHEMEVFTQFSTDLEAETKKFLCYGSVLQGILRQKSHMSYALHDMVALLVCAVSHKMDEVPPKELGVHVASFLQHLNTSYGSLCAELDKGTGLTDELKKQITDAYDALKGLS